MGWNHQRGFCSIFCCSNQQLCFSPGAGWYVWKLRDGRFECELGRTSASLVKIEWTVIYCTWFWHVFTVRSWKMRFLIGVWCWILNGIQSGEWKWSFFFFFGGGVLSQKPTDWAIDGFKKSRVVSTAFGGRRCFFWNCWRYLYLTFFLWEFIVMPKRCQEPCKRDTDAYIIYICTLHICTAWWFRICNPS